MSLLLELKDFLPAYPYQPDHPNDPIFNLFPHLSFNEVTFLKKEYQELKLSSEGEHLTYPDYLKHQKFIARFLSPYTPNDRLLLIHSMGTGKTCSAIAVSETSRLINSALEKTLVLVRGPSFKQEISGEISTTCSPDEKYLAEGDAILLSDPKISSFEKREIIAKARKRVSKNYMIATTRSFAAKLEDMSDSDIRRQFSNRIIIMDEIHEVHPDTHTFDNLEKYKIRSSKEINRRKKRGSDDDDFEQEEDKEKLKHTDTYRSLYRLIAHVENCKFIFLTGTPMYDKSEEWGELINLISANTDTYQKIISNKGKHLHDILPLPYTNSEFEKLFNKHGKLTKDALSKLRKACYGIISYMRSPQAGYVIERMGELYKTMEEIRIYPLVMGVIQLASYQKAIKSDIEFSKNKKHKKSKNPIIEEKKSEPTQEELDAEFEASILSAFDDAVEEAKNEEMGRSPHTPNNPNQLVENDNSIDQSIDVKGFMPQSRQASLFVFPDGSYGKEGFSKYIKVNKSTLTIGIKYDLPKGEPDFITYFKGKDSSPNKILHKIKDHSCKYYNSLKRVINNPTHNAFVYSTAVSGSGCIVYATLLKLFGYTQTNGTDCSLPGKRFAILTKSTTTDTDIRRIIDVFNDSKNFHGEYIQVIIGSEIIGVGFTFKNIRYIDIMTPHWNNSATEQAIARSVRTMSLNALPVEERTTQIYRHAAITDKPDVKTIDIELYQISENKLKRVNQILHFTKQIAVDCQLFKDRNFTEGETEYKCYDVDTTKNLNLQITDSHNFYYAHTEIANIIASVKVLFRTRFSYELFEILDCFRDESIVIVRALKQLIDTSEPIKNMFGMFSYLRENNNVYFLVDQLLLPNAFTLAYYNANPDTTQDIKFEDAIALLQEYTISEFLERYKNYEDEDLETVRRYIENLDIDIVSSFIENAIVAQKQNLVVSKMILLFLEIFSAYIVKTGGITINSINYIRSPHKKILRYLPENGLSIEDWNDATNKIIELYNTRQDDELERLEHTSSYAIIDPGKHPFHIKLPGEREAGKDTRKIYRGKMCKSYHVDGVIQFLIQLNVPIPSHLPEKKGEDAVEMPEIVFPEPAEMARKIIRSKLRFDLETHSITELESSQIYDEETLANMPDLDKLQRMYFWIYLTTVKPYTYNIDQMCDVLKEWYTSNNRVMQKTSKGAPKVPGKKDDEVKPKGKRGRKPKVVDESKSR